jgi:alkylation response protein AidB-like acyl-CoA dehydrogenase
VTTATATERAALLEVTRDFARHELAPHSAALDAGDPGALTDRWRRLTEIGLDRALLAEELGGSGLGILDLLPAIEELAYGDGGFAMCVLLCNAALASLAPEQAAAIPAYERWVLVPVRSETEVRISDGALRGHVASALGAHGADRLVLAVAGGAQPATVDLAADTPGLTLEREEEQMGLRGAPAASITLTGVEYPFGATGSNGDGGGGSEPASALTLLRAGTASIARGIARRAYEMALDYAHERRQGGVAIIEHDAVSDMLGAMAVRLTSPAPAAAGAAQALAAKIAETEAAVASTNDAVQVFGGTGYMCETGIEKLMRDAKYCQLFPEPNWVAQDELIRLRVLDAVWRPSGRVPRSST